jgi:histidyl-tRNA synthetase
MDLSQPRGIRDIEPEEHELHERIRHTFEEVARAYNFRAMEPGPIENIATLRAKSGSQVDEQIYYFRDKADREIGLRFDLTVGMTRYVAKKKDMKLPAKLASYGGVWRYDEPQHARYRWFYQWDIEIFGDPSTEADAEVMDLSYRLFEKLGVKGFLLRVGDRRVVEEYIRKKLGVPSEEKALEMMRAIDKVAKKSEPELIKEYEAKGVARHELSELLRFGRTRGPPSDVLAKLEEHGLTSAAGLAELRDSLSLRGLKNVEYDLSIVRGIDYYTGLVFEVSDVERPDLGSLCGGGRYDVLPKIFGRPDLAATGAAGGVERIALSLSKTGGSRGPSAYVAYTEPTLFGEAMKALASIRERGIRSEIGQRGKALGKQLEDASSRGFDWAVIIGKRELATGEVVLRDMKGRKEERVPLAEVAGRLPAS